MRARALIQTIAAVLLLFSGAHAMPMKSQTAPQHPPFRIVGNIYYVGDTHGSYLISTANGLILVNSNYPDSPRLIRQSVEALGFKWSDIKILLISHSHVDHAGGSAQIVRETDARYMVMQGDVDVVESGGKADYYYGERPEEFYPPTRVDRVLRDGDKVELGGVTLTARLTPGHTKGTTTWTLDVLEDGRTLHVVIIGGSTLNRDVNLINNPKYPAVALDYRQGFAVVRSLPCDVPLGAHDRYFGLQKKYERPVAGEKTAFVDPQGCKRFIDDAEQAFESLLNKQKAFADEGR